MTEPLPQKEFDATSVKPDGYIEIVYFGEEANEIYYFADIDRWHWSEDGCFLVIIYNDDLGRNEVPAVGIRKVRVRQNSAGYVLCQDFLSAAEHVVELENHLRFAEGKMLQKRKEMLKWHATSLSK